MVLNSVSVVNLILEINGKSKLFCQLKRHLSPKTVGLISRAMPIQCNAHKMGNSVIYIETTIDYGMKNDYVTTFLGRRKNTINLKSTNRNIAEAEKRATINMPIQGSASELIKVAMNNIHKKLKSSKIKSKMILQIHDELLFEVHKTELEEVINIVKTEMESAIKFKVPIVVDYNYGLNWYQAH